MATEKQGEIKNEKTLDVVPIMKKTIEVIQIVNEKIIPKNKYVRYAGCIASIFAIMYGARKFYFRRYRKNLQYPNGPIGLPIIGSLMSFVINLDQFTTITLPSYGPISHYRVVNQDMISIHDPKLLYSLLQDERLIHRPAMYLDSIYTSPVVALLNGELWKEGRKLMYSSLVRLMNQTFVESITKKIIDEHMSVSMNESIKKNELYYPNEDCRAAAINTIFATMFNCLLSKYSKDFKDLNYYINVWTNIFFIEVAKKLLLPERFYKHVASNSKYCEDKIFAILDPYIEESLKKFDKNNLQTWLDNMLFELTENEKIKKNIENYDYSQLNLNHEIVLKIKAEVMLLLTAGIESSGYTLEYGILCLAKYPNIQQEIYDELIEIYQDKNCINLNKLRQCVKLRAFFNEVIRCGVPAPRSPRYTYEEVKFKITKDNISDEHADLIGNEYTIPKNCFVDFSFKQAAIFHKQPFDLNNWLIKDEETNNYQFTQKKVPYFIPFSVGKRSCPGEQIARRTIVFEFLQIILSYKFSTPIDENLFIIKTRHGAAGEVCPKLGVKIQKR